jgi:carboxymethylenebutenolidase
MTHDVITVQTADGQCPVHLFAPDGAGRWPAVIMFMDAHGVRPELYDMAKRLADGGYVVALPNLYYRTGFHAPAGATLFSDPALKSEWFARIVPTLSIANIVRDMPAWLAMLDSRSEVSRGAIGVVGYCMGGRLALAVAGHFPERVAAAASYHGGGLATDAPDSPHLLAPVMKARVYVGAAQDDAGFDTAQQERLERALTDAGVSHRIDNYAAHHGWVPSDTAAHDVAATERHWQTLFELLNASFKG